MAKRNAAETLAALDAQAIDDEIERIMDMSDGELMDDLLGDGIAMQAELAEAAECYEKFLTAGALDRVNDSGVIAAPVSLDAVVDAKPAKVVPINTAPSSRPRRVMRRVGVVAASLAMLGGALSLPAMFGVTAIGTVMAPHVSVLSPSLVASSLRTKGANECAAEHWDRCLAQLDEARRMDPGGETRELSALREQATTELRLSNVVGPAVMFTAPAPTP